MYGSASVGVDCSRGYVVSPYTTKELADPPSRAVLEYNPSGDTWSTLQTYPEDLNNGAAWYVNGILYAGLGRTPKIHSLTLKSVAGRDFVCSPETYTITNPLNYSVQWSKSSNLSIVSATATSITVDRYLSYKGPGWVQGVIRDGCATTLIKYVHVGPETANFSLSAYPSCGSVGTIISFFADIGNVNYSWTVNGGVIVNGQGTQSIDAQMTSEYMFVDCYVTGTSPENCYGPQGGSSRSISQCYGFTALNTSPNPASNSVTVELTGQSEDTEPYKVEIRNNSGDVIKSHMRSGNKFVINTEDVPNGMYILRILQKDGILSRRIIIKK